MIITLLVPLLMFGTLKLKAGRGGQINELVSFVKKNLNDHSIIIVQPEWYRLNFVYYYNKEWLKTNLNYNDTLMKNRIFAANDITESGLNQYSRIIYIDDTQQPEDSVYVRFSQFRNGAFQTQHKEFLKAKVIILDALKE